MKARVNNLVDICTFEKNINRKATIGDFEKNRNLKALNEAFEFEDEFYAKASIELVSI